MKFTSTGPGSLSVEGTDDELFALARTLATAHPETAWYIRASMLLEAARAWVRAGFGALPPGPNCSPESRSLWNAVSAFDEPKEEATPSPHKWTRHQPSGNWWCDVCYIGGGSGAVAADVWACGGKDLRQDICGPDPAARPATIPDVREMVAKAFEKFRDGDFVDMPYRATESVAAALRAGKCG